MNKQASEIDFIIGQRLRAKRNERGMSQTVVGEALGVAFQQVQKYEKGVNRLSCPMLLRACKVLGCEPMDIIGGIEI